MDYYSTIKEKIADYVVKDEVVDTDEVISAYKLISIIEKQSERLRRVEEIEKGLLDKVNELYPPVEINAKRKLFGKNRLRSHDAFKKIDHRYSDLFGESTIVLEFESVVGRDTILEKDLGFEGIYSTSGNKMKDEVFDECSEEINTIFDELDFFYGAVVDKTNQESLGYGISQKVNGELIDIELVWNKYKGGKYDIKLASSISKAWDTSDRYYYGREKSLGKIIDENLETILKNMPINISELKPGFQIFIADYMSKEKGKVKEKVSE